MKKILIILLLLMVAIVPVFAIKFSIGASFDLGLSIVRGDHIDDIYDITGLFNDTGNSEDMDINLFSYSPKIDALIELNEYLAIETGVGYRNSKCTYEFTYSDAVENIDFLRTEIVIPVMARFQIPYAGDSKIFFASIGPKVCIPISFYYFYKVEGVTNGQFTVDNAPVILDVAFSLGNDFRISRSNYLGIRVNYDLNILKPHSFGKDTFLFNTRHDVLSATLSCRWVI